MSRSTAATSSKGSSTTSRPGLWRITKPQIAVRPSPIRCFRGPGLLPRDGALPVLAEEFVEGLSEQGLDSAVLHDAEQAQLAVHSRGKVAGDGDGAGSGGAGGLSRRRGARARRRRGCQSQAFRSPMWWRSQAPKARISPAALLRGYASATERPKGRQCAKAARAPMRAGATSAP